jgi:chromosome partitioning protein
MRRIAVINQKGGVGKTTTAANLGAALALLGRRTCLVDVDPQANLSLHLDVEAPSESASIYSVLSGASSFAQAIRPTRTERLTLVPSNLDLSGAELELASAIGRESLLRDAVDRWEQEERRSSGAAPAEYVIFDCPPSLGLLSINALAAAGEVLLTLQTEFFALQGVSKLVEVVQLLRRRLNPGLVITGILPCLYDSRLKLAREVLAEIRSYFPGQVFRQPVRSNVKLAEAPSYGRTIFEYAPDSNGARDYLLVAREVVAQEARDAELAALPALPDERAVVQALNASVLDRAEGPPSAPAEEREPELADAVLTPRPPPARAGKRAADEPRAERDGRIVRAASLPPLPSDAFEDLTSYVRQRH